MLPFSYFTIISLLRKYFNVKHPYFHKLLYCVSDQFDFNIRSIFTPSSTVLLAFPPKQP